MPSQQQIDACYAAIERTAVYGRRCPENGSEGVCSHCTVALAHAGLIRIEISDKNWRTVTILTGPHAGLHTERRGRPWKVIDAAGTHQSGRVTPPARPALTAQPSAPRPLSRSELENL